MEASAAARRLEAHDDDTGSAHAMASATILGEVIALCGSDEFLLELGQLLGSQVIVRPTESVASLVDLVIPTRPQIVAIECLDAAQLERELRETAVGPHRLRMVAFVDAARQREATPPLRRAGVRMVLPLPLASEETRTILLRELEEARSATAARIETGELLAIDLHESVVAPVSGPSDGGRPAWLLPAVFGLLAVAGALGAWYLLGAGDAPAQGGSVRAEQETLEPLPAPVAIPLASGSVEELLDAARAAMRDRRYTEPRNDSALLYFRSIVAQEPANAEALDGVARLAALLEARAQQAMTEGRHDAAAQAAADLRSLRGPDARTTALELRAHVLQMNAAFEANDTERIAGALRQAAQSGAVPLAQLNQWRADLAQRQDQSRLARLVEQGRERLRDGQLVEPPNASARHFALQARELSPRDPAVERLLRDLGATFLQRAREAGLRTSEGERWLVEARALGVTAAQIAALQQRESTARPPRTLSEADRLAQMLQQRIDAGRLTEPQADSAVHYLQQLRSADPAHVAVESGARAIAAGLIGQAQAAAGDGRLEPARAALALARDLGADAAQLQAAEQLIQSREAARGAPLAVAHEKLRRTRAAAPEYPAHAARRGISGSVTVRFVLNTQGEPQDPVVLSAEPRGVFERASLAAVRRWRYAPWIVDGRAVPVETSLVLRFEPQE